MFSDYETTVCILRVLGATHGAAADRRRPDMPKKEIAVKWRAHLQLEGPTPEPRGVKSTDAAVGLHQLDEAASGVIHGFAVGWITLIGMGAVIFAQLMPREAHEQIYTHGLDNHRCRSTQPVGMAEAVDGRLMCQRTLAVC